MGIKITDMDTLPGALDKNDLVEIARPGAGGTANSTYAASMQQIGTYTKNLTNGGFKGEMTKDLTEVTYADVGTWWWHGTPPLSGMPNNGILEVLCSVAPQDVTGPEAPTIVLRLMNGDAMFTKSKPGNVVGNNDTTSVYPWGVCKNKNGNVIFSGVANSDTVDFPVAFPAAPKVLVTPINPYDDRMYVVNVCNITSTGFAVKRYELSLSATTTTSSSTKTETPSGSGTSTTQTDTTTVTYNTFAPSTTYQYYWLATLDG